MDGGAWWATVHGVTKSQTRLSDFTFTFHFHALEKEMATHSSVLAWRISGTEEPDGLPSLGSHRVRHDWSDLAAAVKEAILDRLVALKYICRCLFSRVGERQERQTEFTKEVRWKIFAWNWGKFSCGNSGLLSVSSKAYLLIVKFFLIIIFMYFKKSKYSIYSKTQKWGAWYFFF